MLLKRLSFILIVILFIKIFGLGKNSLGLLLENLWVESVSLGGLRSVRGSDAFLVRVIEISVLVLVVGVQALQVRLVEIKWGCVVVEFFEVVHP